MLKVLENNTDELLNRKLADINFIIKDKLIYFINLIIKIEKLCISKVLEKDIF